MFRKKLLLHAGTPFPLHNSFIDLQLTLECEPHPPPSFFLEIETLCWRVSREFHVACIAEDDNIHIVYQRSQSEAVSKAVIEFREKLRVVIQVEREEEIELSSLVNKAIECSLRSMLLNANWRCLDDGFSFFSSFSSSEERNDICAIQVTAQIGADNGLTFVVSPDVVNFTRHKLMNLIGTGLLQMESNKEVIIDKEDFVTACTVLPTLMQGHVIGLSRSPPGEILLDYEELLFHKYGLRLSVEHFLKVKFIHGGCTKEQWFGYLTTLVMYRPYNFFQDASTLTRNVIVVFLCLFHSESVIYIDLSIYTDISCMEINTRFPSHMVLQGSGLMPVPQTVRALKSISVLESFVNFLEDWRITFFFSEWNFFDGGYIKIKEACQLGEHSDGCLWTKASSSFSLPHVTGIGGTDSCMRVGCRLSTLFTASDFRTPKPPGAFFSKETFNFIQIKNGCADVETVHSLPSVGRSESRSYPQKLPKAANVPLDKHDSSKYTADKRESWRPVITSPNTQEKQSSKPTRKEKVACTANLMGKNTLKCGTADGVTHSEAPRGILSCKKKKIRSGEEQPVCKKRAGTQLENADVTTRVMEHYMRHQLESLTVPELKSFLSAKNVRVGGRKEELIMRVTAMLDLTPSSKTGRP